MSLSYEPLWKMLRELNISKMEFAKMIGISNATLAKLGKNEPITLTTVDKICNHFNCQIENVVTHIYDAKNTEINFTVTVGTIVLTDDLFDKNSYSNKRPCIILKAICNNLKDTPQLIENTSHDKLMYVMAPIYLSDKSKTFPFNIPFKNVVINGEKTNGYVAFGDSITVMGASLFEKKLGVMPENYMQKFNKILQTLDEVLCDNDG